MIWFSSILIVVFAFVSDQLVKTFLVDYLMNISHVPVMPGFNLSLVWNYGISFGLFSDGQVSKFIMPVVMCIVFVTILLFHNQVKKTGNSMLYLALSLVLGGAFGNMFDRISRGGVVDYIDVYIYNFHFPTFNLADVYIFLGAVLFLTLSQFSVNKTPNNKRKVKK